MEKKWEVKKRNKVMVKTKEEKKGTWRHKQGRMMVREQVTRLEKGGGRLKKDRGAER